MNSNEISPELLEFMKQVVEKGNAKEEDILINGCPESEKPQGLITRRDVVHESSR